ncbi:MAG: EAL and HDOD domain-containing protein [Neptuniibacter sp.]
MSSSILLARQPIFDSKLNTVAYELLYRSPEGLGPATPFNGTEATAQVLLHAYSSIFQDGKIKTIPAFINFNAEWLYSGNLPSLKPEALVLEILEDVPVTDELLDRIENLTKAGYRLALDDFIYDKSWDAALSNIQVVKIDIQQLSPTQLLQHLHELKQHNVTLLAEKVETHQQFEYCKSLGFKLFQGYFFCHPQLVEGCKHSASSTTMLHLLAELENSNASPTSLENIISKDPDLVIRLLKIVNSARFAISREISNISEAIIALGLDELKKWTLLIGVSQCQSQTNELTRQILIRAKMCEILSATYSTKSNNAFLLGILSGIDGLLNMPLDQILEQLALANEIKTALLTHEGPLGILLEDVKHFMAGEWDDIDHCDDNSNLALAYQQSIDWALNTMKELHSSA